jgi:hypothetical protein
MAERKRKHSKVCQSKKKGKMLKIPYGTVAKR